MDTTDLVDAGLAGPDERLDAVFTSYAACYGSLQVFAWPEPANGCRIDPRIPPQVDGPINNLGPVTLASIGDGLGQTMFVAERATTLLRDFGGRHHGESGWYFSGNWKDTLFTAMYPPNAIQRYEFPLASSASSLHPGGLNVLMGDGSARFLKDSIQSWAFDGATVTPAGATYQPGGWWEGVPPRGIWQALATRSGREVIDGDGL